MYKRISFTKLLMLSLIAGVLLAPGLAYAQGTTYERLSKVYVDTTLSAGGYERGTCDQPYYDQVRAKNHAGAVGATLVMMEGSQRFTEYQMSATGSILNPVRSGTGRPPECAAAPLTSQSTVYVDFTAPAGAEDGTCQRPYHSWDVGVSRAKSIGAKLMRIDQTGFIEYYVDAYGNAIPTNYQGSGRPPECSYVPGTYPYTGAPVPETVLLGGLLVLGVGFLCGGWVLRRRPQGAA